jgi:4'-phosphopantetheinyl transferase
MCTEGEKEKYRRYHFEKDRWLYLLTRALIRTTLSKYLPGKPSEWRFTTNKYGKPSLSHPLEKAQSLCFNLTNTRGLVALLIANEVAVGIDAEYTDRKMGAIELAHRFFSPTEVAELRSHSPHEQERRFLDYWTLKESFIKAKGMGLSLPLDSFTMLIEDHKVDIEFHGLDETPSNWQFKQWTLDSRHLLATAIHHEGKSPLEIEMRETIPAQP